MPKRLINRENPRKVTASADFAGMKIQSYEPQHLDAVVDISLRAWMPVFEAIQRVMDPEIYAALHPDWRADQQKAVESVCAADEMPVWVAVEEGIVAGFVAVKLRKEDRIGEVYMIAVDPDFQRRGIARELMQFSMEWMRSVGMTVAMVQTGGDPGHAPARQTYENLGFERFTTARYFKKL